MKKEKNEIRNFLQQKIGKKEIRYIIALSIMILVFMTIGVFWGYELGQKDMWKGINNAIRKKEKYFYKHECLTKGEIWHAKKIPYEKKYGY